MLKDSGLSHGRVHVVYILDFFKDTVECKYHKMLSWKMYFFQMAILVYPLRPAKNPVTVGKISSQFS